MTQAQLQTYAQAIQNACGVQGVWGFIDGTHRTIATPILDQQCYYTGAKKRHGIRYQGIVTPDGLISSLCGPWLGKCGDWRMWEESDICEHLREIFPEEDDRLYLYGDPAYVPGFGIIGSFRADREGRITAEQESANVIISGQRIVVEWGFGLVTK